MGAIKGTHIDGDLAVAMDTVIGMNATVRGSATVKHSLRVEGWLDARNIKSPCKGLFRTQEDLEQAYPEPRPGWWAMVGTKSPAALYAEQGGVWADTKDTVALPGNFDMPELSSSVEELQKGLNDANVRLGQLQTGQTALETRISEAESEVSKALGELNGLNERVVGIDTRLTEMEESLPERCPRTFPLDLLESLQTGSSEREVSAAFTAYGEETPVLPRPGDRLESRMDRRRERSLVVTKSERNRLVTPAGQSVSWCDGASETTVWISGFIKVTAKETVLLSPDAVIDLETGII